MFNVDWLVGKDVRVTCVGDCGQGSRYKQNWHSAGRLRNDNALFQGWLGNIRLTTMWFGGLYTKLLFLKVEEEMRCLLGDGEATDP